MTPVRRRAGSAPMRLGPKTKAIVRKVHLALALTASLPLLVLSVTGALLVFPEETRAILASDDLTVVPGERFLSPSKLLAAATPALPDGDTVRRLQYPRSGSEPLIVEAKEVSVLVDPYTGRILSVASSKTDFNRIVTSIHVSLLAGETGRWITSISSLALVALCVSGLWLWTPVGRFKLDHFRVAFRKGWKRTNWDLHRTVGFYSAAMLLVIAGTGAAIGFWDAAAGFVYFATWSEPTRHGRVVEVDVRPGEDRPRLEPDRILEMALAEFPGHEPHRFYFPATPEKPYRVFLDPPGEHELRTGEVRLEMDPFDGTILLEESPRTMSRGDATMRWVLPLHYGTFGGTPTKALWFVVSLSPIGLAATGTTLWLVRRAKRRRAKTAASALALNARDGEHPRLDGSTDSAPSPHEINVDAIR